MARISLAHSKLRDGGRSPGELIELPHLVSKAPYRMADWGIIISKMIIATFIM